ncbi:hypothetical protein [Nubsella zeaxanthinifaciens]|uniref:hypothetical protein n=1 Tax=Nubsella zeaxanthinifaciens TaxID=392412 RepID=UPI000DE4692F|nr:hypothetical protein [Nubsella zeaxanthinifaciens]
MATFNWSYKPSVANKYGITIASSADDVKPSNAVYVAHWGNDITGNGSRLKPYKTINKANVASTTVILASGTYRESLSTSTNNVTLVGDGNVILDISYLGVFKTGTDCSYLNIKIVGSGASVLNNGNTNFRLVDCWFDGAIPTSSGGFSLSGIVNCTFSNITATLSLGSYQPNKSFNCTFVNCNSIVIANSTDACIFYRCNLSAVNVTSLNAINTLYYECNFKMTNGTGSGGGIYPTVPAGYTNFTTISALMTAYNAYVGVSQSFSGCTIVNPAFNNIDIKDYSLSLSSPARNMSYFGTYIGAYSITKALAVKATASLSAFDNSSAINLTIADNSLTLIDVDSVASIVTKPIDNTAGRELQRLLTFGINADRNGEYVDSTVDLANTTISAGTNLATSTPYLVEVGTITYDGNVYNAGQRFTSKSSSPGTFTTATGGVLREILEAPARENVEARFSDGALTTVDNTATLEELAWYFVEGNAATYNGNSYAVGTFIKVLTGITSFTGTGLLRKVFSDADAYFYFEINQKPTSNNVGNSRTGAIVRGNGDKDFDRTAANVFPISKKFIQLRYTIQVNNLTP